MLSIARTLLLIIALSLGARAQNSSCFSAIEWKPCTNAAQAECSFYQVPLDYAHPEVGNATLAVARIKASNEPRLGSLFINPGGPGGSGVQTILEFGELLSVGTNNQYDIVSWDPRGVNQSQPQISCGFTTLDELAQFWNSSTAVPGFAVEARGNFTDQDDLDAIHAGLNETDAKLKEFGQKCLDSDGAFLKYMGSAAAARDMVSLSDCLEGPGKPVNYWGFSYGTVIGNYFVNMFPERVGHVVLDGVVDTVVWSTEPSFKYFDQYVPDAEDTFARFTQQCAEAGPAQCAFAKNDSTPASLSQDVRALINDTYDLHKAGRPVSSAFDLRCNLLSALHLPLTWAEIAGQLASMEQTIATGNFGNGTSGFGAPPPMRPRGLTRRHDGMSPTVLKPDQNVNVSQTNVDPNIQGLMLDVAISCLDSIDQGEVTTKEVLDATVRFTHDVSPMFGEAVANFGVFYCHRFPVRAVERFTGPFNHHLANPIIVIGNAVDPATPFKNAEKIAGLLGSSARLLKQNGFGHTSIAENSNCTHGVISDYFLHGKLPNAGQVCEVDDNDLFPTNGTAAPSIISVRREV